MKNLILFLFLNTTVLISQDAPISISSSVDRNKITIGDLITYTVTITHDPEIQVALPGLGANLGGFEIRDYQAQDPEKIDGKIISRVDYTIATFFTGEFIIPQLAIGYILPNDSTMQVLATEKIKIVVESMKASEAGDIRDVKSPLEIPWHWWYTFRYYIFGGIFLLLLGMGYWGYRRHKSGKSILPIRTEPSRPPHEIALEALEKLQQSDLLSEGLIKEFYIELSDIIRHYIEGRYFITAMEMTTCDVLRGLQTVDIKADCFTHSQTFLERCDLVKFAKFRPDDAINEDSLGMAVNLIEMTKVVIEPEPDAEESDACALNETNQACLDVTEVVEEDSSSNSAPDLSLQEPQAKSEQSESI